jgi:hypothetical protein
MNVGTQDNKLSPLWNAMHTAGPNAMHTAGPNASEVDGGGGGGGTFSSPKRAKAQEMLTKQRAEARQTGTRYC